MISMVQGDARALPIADSVVQCCVTSPPYYGLRDYGVVGQIGLEDSVSAYVDNLVQVFREVRRVMTDDGTLWLNLGDSYGATGGDTASGFNERYFGKPFAADKQSATAAKHPKKSITTGLRAKNLLGVPWQVAFALQADGWYLRSDIIWAKPNPMPESVTDRPTKAHEYLFLLTKQAKYYYDHVAVMEQATSGIQTRTRKNGLSVVEQKQQGGAPNCGVNELRNRRTVWTITPKPFKGAHFAVMPEALVEPCILAGTRARDIVLDPFAGSGTVGVVAQRHGRDFIGIELNPAYLTIAKARISAAKETENAA